MKSISESLTIGNSTGELRVKNFKKNLLSTSKDHVRHLIKEFNNLQNDLESLLDFAPSNTTDLWSNLKNINVDTTINDIYKKAEDLAILLKEIKVAEKIHNTLFPEDKIDATKEIDEDFLADLW